MTTTNTYRWTGKLGSDWNADVPNPPGPNKTNWDLISNPGAPPRVPSGAGALAVIDLGAAITIMGRRTRPPDERCLGVALRRIVVRQGSRSYTIEAAGARLATTNRQRVCLGGW